jgi:hypothetical protein
MGNDLCIKILKKHLFLNHTDMPRFTHRLSAASPLHRFPVLQDHTRFCVNNFAPDKSYPKTAVIASTKYSI